MCFFKHRYVLSRKHTIKWINTPASRERKLDFQFLTCVSPNIWCLRTVGLISIRFTGIDQLRITFTPTKMHANWMNASSWFFLSKSTAFSGNHRLANKRTQWPTLFREWFSNSEVNRHDICTRLRKRVTIRFENCTWICQISLHEINDEVQT